MHSHCTKLHPGRAPVWICDDGTLRSCLLCSVATARDAHAITAVRRAAISRILYAAHERSRGSLGESVCERPQVLADLPMEMLDALCEFSVAGDEFELEAEMLYAIVVLTMACDDASNISGHHHHAFCGSIMRHAVLLLANACAAGDLTSHPRHSVVIRCLSCILSESVHRPSIALDQIALVFHTALSGHSRQVSEGLFEILSQPLANGTDDGIRCATVHVLSALISMDELRFSQLEHHAEAVSFSLRSAASEEQKEHLVTLTLVFMQKCIEQQFSDDSKQASQGQSEAFIRLYNEMNKSSMLLDAIKACVLSPRDRIRATLADLISLLCAYAPSAPQDCADSGIVDYLYESLRENATGGDLSQGSTPAPLLVSSLRSLFVIAEHNPPGMQLKWDYGLETVVSAILGARDDSVTDTAFRLFQSAFRHAPVSSLRTNIIERFVDILLHLATRVSVQLRIGIEAPSQSPLPTGSDRTSQDIFASGLNCLAHLVSRYRIPTLLFHSLIDVCEVACCFAPNLLAGAQITNWILEQFIDLHGSDTVSLSTSEAIQDSEIADKLSVLSLGVWGAVAADIFSNYDQSVHQSMDFRLAFVVLQVVTSALDPRLLRRGTYSADDVSDLLLWCWKAVPPKAVFALVSSFRCSAEPSAEELHAQARSETVSSLALLVAPDIIARTYLCRVVSKANFSAGKCQGDTSPITDAEFRLALASDPGRLSSNLAFSLLLTGIANGDIETSVTDVRDALDALESRVRTSAASPSAGTSECVFEGLQVILKLCQQHSLRIDRLNLPCSAWTMAVSHKRFSPPTIPDFFLFVITHISARDVQLIAWSRYAECRKHGQASSLCLDESICSLITSDQNATEGLIFALSSPRAPAILFEAILELCNLQEGLLPLTKALLTAGLGEAACEVFRNYRLDAGQLSLNQSQRQAVSPNEERIGCPQIARVAFLLEVLARGGSIAWSDTVSRLTLIVCDAFVDQQKDDSDPANEHLRLAMTRFLIALLHGGRAGKSKSCYAYVARGVVGVYAAKFLESAAKGHGRGKDFSAAASACLIVLLLEYGAHDNGASRAGLISLLKELPKESHVWAQLVSTSGIDDSLADSCRATNCAFLLAEVLRLQGRDGFPNVVKPNFVLVAALVAEASGNNSLLRDAALKALSSLMSLSPSDFGQARGLCVHWAFSQTILKSSTHIITLSTPEIVYLTAAVRCGHANSFIKTVRSQLIIALEQELDRKGAPAQIARRDAAARAAAEVCSRAGHDENGKLAKLISATLQSPEVKSRCLAKPLFGKHAVALIDPDCLTLASAASGN